MARIKFYIAFSLFLALGISSQAQDRYAVYFKFKPQSEFSLSRPQEFLTQKALDRRLREGIAIDSLDLPVSEKYLLEVGAWSEYVLYTSKWMNAAVLVVNDAGAEAIEALPFVDRVELVAKGFLKKPGARVVSQTDFLTDQELERKYPKLNSRQLGLTANSYDFQNQLIGIDRMHEEGYTGEGVTIAVFDAGFPGVDTISSFAHLFANDKIIAQRDFVRPWSKNAFIGHQHGTNVLSLIAANDFGKLVSGAYNSDFVLVITEEVETEYRVEEFNWIRGAEFSDSLGVDIINSSLGYWDFDESSMNYTLDDLDGNTAIITKGAATASSKGILVVNSVGNDGTRNASSLLVPADAADIITVGSVTNSGEVSSFSSRGPTSDGRVKPELAAFGNGPILLRSNGSTGASNGTSFSAPQITALAAGLWEAKPEWTKRELMNNLYRSATQYENPDNLLGYGVPNFYQALYGEVLGVGDEAVLWSLYPNPVATDELKINFGTGNSLHFELVDMTGRVLLRSELERASPKEPYTLSLSGIKAGLYLVILREGVNIKQAKLLRH
jgi:subtilisin family serine protease